MVSCGRSGREKPYSLQNGLGFTNETSYLRAPCLKRVGYNRVLANQSPICAGPDTNSPDQLKESPNVCYTAAGTSSTRRHQAGEIVYQNIDCITKDLRDSGIKIDCTTGSCETGFTYTRADQTTIIVNSMEVNEQGNNIDDDDDADTRAAIAMSMQCIDDVSPTKDAAFDGASPMVKQLEPLGLNADNIHDNTARDWCNQKLIRDPNDTKKTTHALEEETMHPGKAPELRDSGIIHGSVINTKVMDNDTEPIHNSITDAAVHMAIILSLQCESEDSGASNMTAEQKTATLPAGTTTNTCDETILMNRSPSYENKPFDSENLSSDGLEQDAIYTMDPQQSLLTCVPEKIPRDYVDNTGAVPGEQQPSSCMGWFFHRKKPDDVSPIYIQHPYATDSQILGDRFGAKLATYKWKKTGNIYYQHFLTDVTDKSPADAMKIQDYDELVLLNDSFVPNLNHEEVKRLFTNVKVDSHTRLTLIIRRITIPDRKHEEWLWYKTSTILFPELDHEPCVRELQYDPVPGGWDHRFWARMHALNGALYLTVTQDDVTIDKLVSSDPNDPRDNQRKICVWCKVLADQDTGLLNHYVLALFGYHRPPNPEPFVAINIHDKAVVLKGTACWYDFRNIGSQYYIKKNGQYLGSDGANKVGLHKDEQYFVMTGIDKPNSSVQPHDTMDFSSLSN